MVLLNSLIHSCLAWNLSQANWCSFSVLPFARCNPQKHLNPKRSQVPVMGIFVREGAQGGISPTLVLALRHRVCHPSWLSSSTCNQQGYLWRQQVGLSVGHCPSSTWNTEPPLIGCGDTWRTGFDLMPHSDQVWGVPPKGLTQVVDRWNGQMGIYFYTYICLGFTTSVSLFVSPLRMWSKPHIIMLFCAQGHRYFHSRSSKELSSVYNMGHMTGCIPIPRKGLTVPFN